MKHLQWIKNHKEAWNVVIIYIIFGFMWIYFSDTILDWLVSDPDVMTKIAISKGLLFILFTSLLLFFLTDRLCQRNKQSNSALRKSEETYRLLVENQTDLIVNVDLDGRLLYVNPLYCKTFGKEEEDLLGQKFMPLVHEEDRDSTEKAMEALFSPPYVAHMEQRAKTVCGWRWFAWADTAVFDEEDNVTGVIGIARDITNRKIAEEKNSELQKQLLQAKKMEALGLMAGGVAHDLNNILSGIVAYPDLILQKLPPASELRKPIEAIQQSGKRAAEVVGDLLTVARGGGSKKEVSNLNEIVVRYLKSAEGKSILDLHPDIQIKTKLATDLLNCSCSPVHIQKCLMNLVTNAIESIDHSGVIELSTRNQYIDKPISSCHTVVEKGDYVVVSISDTGSGISDEAKNHIFEPFYTKKTMGHSGTGLGLAIVWNTVHDHGGTVTVSSDGGGTTFELYFQISREEVTEIPKNIKLETIQGNSEHILVVDDEPQQRDIACEILNRLGYQVDAVNSGYEAIEFTSENSPDLIVLDMIMEPGMNGRATYEKILETDPSQKAIIVSGFSEDEEVRKAQSLGVVEFVKKPYTLVELGQIVKKELLRNNSIV